MTAREQSEDFVYYMHDGPDAFSFEVAGKISEGAARELAQAWKTASSTVDGRCLIVDLSYVTGVDAAGLELLRRWYESGARLVAKRADARRIVASITGEAPEMVQEDAPFPTWRALHALLLIGLALVATPAL